MAQLIFYLFFLWTFSVNSEEPLVVGMELSYPPFETIDKEGKPVGISVDIAYALGEYLNRPVKIENVPFIGLIPSLKSGKIDAIISSMSPTPQREKAIAFSKPYLQIGLSLLISKNSTLQNIEGADEPSRTVVVKQGTTGESFAMQNLKKARVLVLDKESSCVLEVIQGKADAFIYDQLSVYTNWQKNLNTTRAELKPFKVENWAIGVRKEDKELLDKINAFLVKLRSENGLEKTAKRYLKNQLEAFKELGVPFQL